MERRILFGVAVFALTFAGPLAGERATFVPDWTFKGSTLAGWHTLGDAGWRAENGELIGSPRSPEGGWLVLDKSFQDVQVGFDFKMAAGVKTGLPLRAEKTPAGMKGVFVSLGDSDTGAY